MRRVVDAVTRGVYGLLGSFYLLLGIVVMLLGTGILPSWVHVRIFRVDAGGAFTAREYGAALIGTLLLTWFAKNVTAADARGASPALNPGAGHP